MRIGYDAHLVTARPTGVGKAITRTIEAMVDAALPDEDFVVFANRSFPGLFADRDNCRVIRTRGIGRSRVLRVLHERFRMASLARRHRVDVFYAPGYVYPARLDCPLVLGIYDVNAIKLPLLVRPETARYYGHEMPRSAGRAELIVAPTDAVAADIRKHLDVRAGRLRVVPLAADDRFRESPGDPAPVKARLGIDAPYVLFVGNIEPNKNLSLLVQAFFAAKLNAELPHKLIIAGKRRHKARRLDRLIRDLDCADHILFPGYVDDADLPALYAGADAFLYPSHMEGFGIPPLEAMLCGTPTITSQDAAVVEVTGPGAMHVAAGDLPGWREALEQVLTDRAFAKKQTDRGRRVAEQYSWAETGRQTMAVIREAFARSEQRSGTA
jgi:glycosyltransferase involved in cell wall biosynthesis